MKFRTKPETIVKFAMIIAENVDKIEDVDLMDTKKNSLLRILAKQHRRTFDKRFQNQVRNLWTHEEGSLKAQVLENLRIKHNQNALSTSASSYNSESNSTSSPDVPVKKNLRLKVKKISSSESDGTNTSSSPSTPVQIEQKEDNEMKNESSDEFGILRAVSQLDRSAEMQEKPEFQDSNYVSDEEHNSIQESRRTSRKANKENSNSTKKDTLDFSKNTPKTYSGGASKTNLPLVGKKRLFHELSENHDDSGIIENLPKKQKV